MALALEPPARLHAIEIAVDVELEVDRGVIPRPSDVQRLDRLEAQFLQIKPVNERIDDANRIILADPVIEASRQQPQLPPIRLLNEPRHLSPRRFSKRIIASGDFSHSLGHQEAWRSPYRYGRSSSESGLNRRTAANGESVPISAVSICSNVRQSPGSHWQAS